MPRIRSIKPEFFTSETIASLPLSARLTFIGLWTYVDDNGVGVDNPRLINAAIWPLEDDPLETLRRVSGDLQSLADAGLIQRYEVSGRRYLFITSWDEHQKVSHPSKPRYPRPTAPGVTLLTSDNTTLRKPSGGSPETIQSPPETLAPEQGTGSREQGAGNRGEREGDPPQAAPREPKGTRIPDDFEVTPAMRAWFREHCPGVDGPTETAKFRDYWRAQPGAKGRRTDWEATWRNWMRKAAEDTRRRPTTPAIATGANRHIDRRDDNPFRSGANATYASTTGGTR